MGMFDWTEKPSDVLRQGGVIAPDERLPWPQTAAMGVQHVIAMFGATVLAPILMGFDPNIAILMSGIGTLVFFLITGGKVPSYLGSSFAFIGVVIAATAYAGKGPNGNIGVALGGIIACGIVYILIGAIVQAVGTGWVERLMPPVVTGAVVAVIGLNLAGIPIKNMAASNFDSWMQAVTFTCVGLVAVFTRGMVQRLLILVGLVDRQHRLRRPRQRPGPGQAAGLSRASPTPPGSAHRPSRRRCSRPSAMLLIAPVAIILVAENLGHIKAVTAMTGRNLDQYMGRAFIGDGVATVISGACRRHRRHDLRREHRRDGRDQDLLHRGIRGGGGHRHRAGLLAQVRRRDPGHPAAGDGRRLHRGVRPDRRGRRQDLGGQPGGLLAEPQPDRRGHHAGAGHGRFHAQVRRLRARRHRHRHLRRHPALCIAQPRRRSRVRAPAGQKAA